MRGLRRGIAQNTLRTGIKRGKKPRTAKKKEKSISALIKQADALMSKNVRYSNLNEHGLQTCYTCGHKTDPKKIHNGHFLSRYYKAARWNPDNTRPQCFMCNIYKKGDTVRFRQNLIKEIGLARVEAVEALRDQPTKLTKEFLQDKIKELKCE